MSGGDRARSCHGQVGSSHKHHFHHTRLHVADAGTGSGFAAIIAFAAEDGQHSRQGGCQRHGNPFCQGGRTETPPATPLQQFLPAASSHKASPGRRMSRSRPFRGLCQLQPRAHPERQSPRHPHHDTHKSFTCSAVAGGGRGPCLSFPPLQINHQHPSNKAGAEKLVGHLSLGCFPKHARSAPGMAAKPKCSAPSCTAPGRTTPSPAAARPGPITPSTAMMWHRFSWDWSCQHGASQPAPFLEKMRQVPL